MLISNIMHHKSVTARHCMTSLAEFFQGQMQFCAKFVVLELLTIPSMVANMVLHQNEQQTTNMVILVYNAMSSDMYSEMK